MLIIILVSAGLSGFAAEDPDNSGEVNIDIEYSGVSEGETESDETVSVKSQGVERTIVVTGTRNKKRLKDSPVITEVITGEEINESRAGTLSEVMEDYGLQFMKNAMGNYIRLQGMEASRILFLVDGRRLSGRVAQRLDASTVPVSNIDRIEIVRGPQSLLYGSDGIGGVINIITKKPEEGFSVRGRVTNGFIDPEQDDDFFLEQTAQTSMNFSLGPVYSRVYGNFSQSDYVLSEDEQTSVSPRYVQGEGGAVVGITPSKKIDLTLGGDYSRKRSDDRTSRYGSYERTETTRSNAYMDTLYSLSDKWSFSGKFYYNHYLRDQDKYSALTGTWDSSDDREEEDLFVGELFSDVVLSKSNTLTAGVEASYDKLYKYNIGEDGGGDEKDRYSQSIVVQDEQAKRNSYSVLGGIRVDHDSLFGCFASPKISAMYYLAKNLRALAGIGVGYRAPNFSDLYLVKDTSGHPVVLGNEDLRPEKSLGVNLGVEYASGNMFFQLNLFHNELKDEIVNEDQGYQDAGRDVYIKENLDRTTRSGFDCEGRITFLDYISLSAGYNFVVGYDRRAGDFLEDQPMHVVRGKISYNNNRYGLLVYVNGRYQSDAEDIEGTHVFVLNGYVSKGLFDHIRVFFSAENLTDEVNLDVGLEKGRYFSMGVEAWY